MRRNKGPLEGQIPIAWDLPPPLAVEAAESPPEPPPVDIVDTCGPAKTSVDIPRQVGPVLDESGHRFWAQFCRDGVTLCVARANADVPNAGEWAKIAKRYKDGAAKHEARANQLAGGS